MSEGLYECHTCAHLIGDVEIPEDFYEHVACSKGISHMCQYNCAAHSAFSEPVDIDEVLSEIIMQLAYCDGEGTSPVGKPLISLNDAVRVVNTMKKKLKLGEKMFKTYSGEVTLTQNEVSVTLSGEDYTRYSRLYTDEQIFEMIQKEQI
jgi:hypothetical protein